MLSVFLIREQTQLDIFHKVENDKEHFVFSE